jgi:hypothetical protein
VTERSARAKYRYAGEAAAAKALTANTFGMSHASQRK